MLLEYDKDAIKRLSISAHERLKYELDKTLLLPYFISELIDKAKTNDPNFHGTNSLYKQPYPRTIRIAPSVQEMYDSVMRINNDIKRLQMSDASSEEKAKIQQDMIRDVIKPKAVLTLDEPLDIWWGDSIKGINIRVGFINNDRSKCFPFKIGGTQSHMLAGGNTGEGKSVVMNAFLTSFLTEYPPWEAQIFMNDMKMLEYARYIMNDKCPQIRNVAITGSSTYLISVLKYMDDEMKLMYNLATMTGANSLAGMRDYLDLYIPRVICCTDEFSQLSENATSKERSQAEFYIQSIAKLGRAVGYHLILTTQNFKGALPATTLGQFKVGVCVGANEDNSESIIGNTGAVELTKKIGYCLVNNNRATGDIANNIEYKVAFIDDKTAKDKQDFQDILKRVSDKSKSLGIVEEPTSFNEKTQTAYSNLGEDIQFNNNASSLIINEKNICDLTTLTLGDGTRYTGTSQTKEYFIWDYARNSNILIHSMDKDDIKYLCYLIGDNLQANAPSINHRMIIDNTELFEDDYVPKFKKDLTGLFNFNSYLNAALKRDTLLKYNLMQESNNQPTDLITYLNFVAKSDNNADFLEFLDLYDNLIQSLDFDFLRKLYTDDSLSLPQEHTEVYKYLVAKQNVIYTLLVESDFYNKYDNLKIGQYLRASDFKPTIFWMFSPQLNEGISKRGMIDSGFLQLLGVGPSVGIFFIIVLDNPKEQRQLILNCKHILFSKPNPALTNTGLVNFSDTSEICCKYTVCQGDDNEQFYFKKYFKN